MQDTLPSNVHVSTHPCLRAKLSQLRDKTTNARETKALIHEIATIIGCEALAQSLDVQSAGTAQTPLNYTYTPTTITPTRVSLVPILRSGLSMLDALTTLLPNPVPVHHLGLYREKTTLQPVEYYNNLPYHSSTSTSSTTTAPTSSTTEGFTGPSDLAIILDPIIATGATAAAAIETLKDWGVKRVVLVSVLGSKEGVRRAAQVWSEGTSVWVGGVDEETDERGMIKPGLGDVGDRLFLTIGK
ncbi:putative uracil phosphoribosyltransferase urg2 [Saccharata proteae CBS 121410]|uniref:uracil phosphoribosyltransferase n=1 Tax=Saccharata proteae CBS 121410 TaxID=1314787 RepID=A0A9P4LXL8_9PEZI|nr:putative uracil phosphoribosyltransferase urg2 [Saccharata proteae CBS 121410]